MNSLFGAEAGLPTWPCSRSEERHPCIGGFLRTPSSGLDPL